MFAIAFDLTVAEVQRLHPRSVRAGYEEIGRVLARFSFEWAQGSVYVCRVEDLGNLYSAISALKALPWFGRAVRDIRAFRMEQWVGLHADCEELKKSLFERASFTRRWLR